MRMPSRLATASIPTGMPACCSGRESANRRMVRKSAGRLALLQGDHYPMPDARCFPLPPEGHRRRRALRPELERAMRLSLRWAERCKRAFEALPQTGRALFGIVQGGDDSALRLESARALIDMDFHGYAIGGLAVGEAPEVMLATIDSVAPALPMDRPRYLMGVGTPTDLLEAVARGIDM